MGEKVFNIGMFDARSKAAALLREAGLTVDGPNDWDPQVKNPRVFNRIFSGGTLAVGESYMDGDWDVEDMSGMVARMARARVIHTLMSIGTLGYMLAAIFLNLQNPKRAFQVAQEHYDIGNDLYSRMLDARLTYTCGYWSGSIPARNLDEAQEAKLDLVCRKVGLKSGDRVLDIGCGWGSFLIYAAEKYGITGVGITVSVEQKALADKLIAEKGLSDKIEIRIQDYRETADGPYDAIISIGMFEHVGRKNFRTYFEKARALLKPDGLFLLHTIGSNETRWIVDPWMHKYIFPNGYLPSPAQIGAGIDTLFVLEDWHNFGPDYDKTLMCWHDNFVRTWPEIRHKYSERFYRMWRLYLLSMAGNFRARNMQLWQIVLSPHGVDGGYRSIR